MMGVHSTFFVPAKVRLAAAGAECAGTGRRQCAAGDRHVSRRFSWEHCCAGLLAGNSNTSWIAAVLLLVALIGFASSLGIPKAQAVAPGQRLDQIRGPRRWIICAPRASLVPCSCPSWACRGSGSSEPCCWCSCPRTATTFLHGDESLVTVTIAMAFWLLAWVWDRCWWRAAVRQTSGNRPGAFWLHRPDAVRRGLGQQLARRTWIRQVLLTARALLHLPGGADSVRHCRRRRVRRLFRRTAECAGAAALAPGSARPRHRRQQHFECAGVMVAAAVLAAVGLAKGLSVAAANFARGAERTRQWRSISTA